MTQTQAPQASLSLEKIYLKDVSYEAPGAPDVFLQNQAPAVEVQLSIGHRLLDAGKGFHEVVLSVQIHAKRDDKVVFLVDVHQAGVFRVQGLSGEMLERALEIGAAHILLPFAREAINDFIGKGGFPQFLIAPINFEALYEQKKSAAMQPAQGNA